MGIPIGGVYIGVFIKLYLNLMGAICLTERSIMLGVVPGIQFGIIIEAFLGVDPLFKIGLSAVGVALHARLECPITLVLKNALGIQFGIDFVLKPCSFTVAAFFEYICGFYLFGIKTCRKTWIFYRLYMGNTIRIPLMFFESIPPDTTPPSVGVVTLTQLTTRRLELSWTGFTEAESELLQFQVDVFDTALGRAVGAVLQLVVGGTEEQYSGEVQRLPQSGAILQACVRATNIARLSTYVCSETIVWDVSPPRFKQLWLRQTLTGKWVQPCCAGVVNCGTYTCDNSFAQESNATHPEFQVELLEWPLTAHNNFSKVRWTVRNTPMQWEDDGFQDIGYENILSTVWASNCSANAWGCLQGRTTLMNVTSDAIVMAEGLNFLTIMACDVKDNCGFLHSSPLLVDRTPPMTPAIYPFKNNYSQTCCFTHPATMYVRQWRNLACDRFLARVVAHFPCVCLSVGVRSVAQNTSLGPKPKGKLEAGLRCRDTTRLISLANLSGVWWQ